MQPISFELCIQCFFKFSLMHKKRILSDPLFVFLPYGRFCLFFNIVYRFFAFFNDVCTISGSVLSKELMLFVLEQIRKIQRLSADKAEASELKIQIALMEIWLLIYEHVEPGAEEQSGYDRDTERIRCIMVYIQEHYAEKITLEELAEIWLKR